MLVAEFEVGPNLGTIVTAVLATVPGIAAAYWAYKAKTITTQTERNVRRQRMQTGRSTRHQRVAQKKLKDEVVAVTAILDETHKAVNSNYQAMVQDLKDSRQETKESREDLKKLGDEVVKLGQLLAKQDGAKPVTAEPVLVKVVADVPVPVNQVQE